MFYLVNCVFWGYHAAKWKNFLCADKVSLNVSSVLLHCVGTLCLCVLLLSGGSDALCAVGSMHESSIKTHAALPTFKQPVTTDVSFLLSLPETFTASDY